MSAGRVVVFFLGGTGTCSITSCALARWRRGPWGRHPGLLWGGTREVGVNVRFGARHLASMYGQSNLMC